MTSAYQSKSNDLMLFCRLLLILLKRFVSTGLTKQNIVYKKLYLNLVIFLFLTVLIGQYVDFTICFGGQYGKILTSANSFSVLSNGYYWKIQTPFFVFPSQVWPIPQFQSMFSLMDLMVMLLVNFEIIHHCYCQCSHDDIIESTE